MPIKDLIDAEIAEAAATRTREPLTQAASRAHAAKVAQQEQAMPAGQRPPRDRVPFGTHEQALSWPAIPGFRLYWFNDMPGRIERAKLAGYEHVEKNGEPVSMIVDKSVQGTGLRAYLMKIPTEWYQEDKAANEQYEAEKIRNIQEGSNLKDLPADQQHFYVDKSRTHLVNRR